MKQEYRVVKDLNSYSIKLIIHYKTFTECSAPILAKQTLEELRSEVFKIVEAFGKKPLDGTMRE